MRSTRDTCPIPSGALCASQRATAAGSARFDRSDRGPPGLSGLIGSLPSLTEMRVKFCGITRYDDAEHAARLGAWAIGLNHWEGSVRRCDHAVAAEIGAGLRRKLEIVGVFVNQPMTEIARAVENEHLSMVQLHGDEGLSFCHEVTRRTGCPVIKAIRVRSSADIDYRALVPRQLPPARRLSRGHARRHGPHGRLGAPSPPPLEGAADPRRRPHPRERRRGDRRYAPVRGRRRERRRVGARDQGSRADDRVRRPRPRRPAGPRRRARSPSPSTSSSRWRRTSPGARPRPPSGRGSCAAEPLSARQSRSAADVATVETPASGEPRVET